MKKFGQVFFGGFLLFAAGGAWATDCTDPVIDYFHLHIDYTAVHIKANSSCGQSQDFFLCFSTDPTKQVQTQRMYAYALAQYETGKPLKWIGWKSDNSVDPNCGFPAITIMK